MGPRSHQEGSQAKVLHQLMQGGLDLKWGKELVDFARSPQGQFLRIYWHLRRDSPRWRHSQMRRLTRRGMGPYSPPRWQSGRSTSSACKEDLVSSGVGTCRFHWESSRATSEDILALEERFFKMASFTDAKIDQEFSWLQSTLLSKFLDKGFPLDFV